MESQIYLIDWNLTQMRRMNDEPLAAITGPDADIPTGKNDTYNGKVATLYTTQEEAVKLANKIAAENKTIVNLYDENGHEVPLKTH